ncbi:prephenate dehydrogenase [Ichthyobacterium seriolicida]|uniref:Prephenate dehydrogenase n=1 Tax=Ichthyobacterium seriolicida TaxID=242600 RepID=A0A1J1E5H4_9FLAO|nr:prephenate dehydrogenase [Ichthyobacterium seriolicida]BAV95300.1 prephenate dehydrogenase [Ichthyobacterium seriolicida]
MIVSIIGLGLMGGSMALSLRQKLKPSILLGVEKKLEHADIAIKLGIVDRVCSLEEAIDKSDVIVLALPVNDNDKYITSILDGVKESSVIFDMGSTKESICSITKNHANRKQFVATHPIAGTEHSGPEAAFDLLFKNKLCIICDKEKSSPKAIELVENIYEKIGMNIIEMDSSRHDKHIAYVSHISHISSFALGHTVLEIEKDQQAIFNMAGSGFASTVRLAKSSSKTWVPIFRQNSDNILMALNKYIENLEYFRDKIESKSFDDLDKYILRSNDIKRVLEGIKKK